MKNHLQKQKIKSVNIRNFTGFKLIIFGLSRCLIISIFLDLVESTVFSLLKEVRNIGPVRSELDIAC